MHTPLMMPFRMTPRSMTLWPKTSSCCLQFLLSDLRFWLTYGFLISSMDNLEKFVNDLLDDKLEPYLKSEPVPTQNEAVKVKILRNCKLQNPSQSSETCSLFSHSALWETVDLIQTKQKKDSHFGNLVPIKNVYLSFKTGARESLKLPGNKKKGVNARRSQVQYLSFWENRLERFWTV